MAFKGRRQSYETAFDSKVENNSNENVDLFDRIANHPLVQLLHIRKRSKTNSDLSNQKLKSNVKCGSSFHTCISKTQQPPSKVGVFSPQNLRCLRKTSRSISSNQLTKGNLRPIGLSKSDNEILNRSSSESNEEDECFDDYVEGRHARVMSDDIHFLQNKRIAYGNKSTEYKGNDIPSKTSNKTVHKSSAHFSDRDKCDFVSQPRPSFQSINRLTCSPRPFSPALVRLGGARVRPQKDAQISPIPHSSKLSKSQALPSQCQLKPIIKLQSPPGTAPLPVKFQKQHSPLAGDSPPSWFSPIHHKNQHLFSKRNFKLSNRGSSMDSSDAILSDSMEVLLDSSSENGSNLKVFPAVHLKYSSTESMQMGRSMSGTSSMESLRSSKSCMSNESTSSSFQSSSLGSDPLLISRPVLNLNQPHRSLIQSAKLQILSPISDKSQEPFSEGGFASTPQDILKTPIQTPRNIQEDFRNVHHILPGPVTSDKKPGSDSGISTEYRQAHTEITNCNLDVPYKDLPFDMPKLRRRLAAVNLSNSNSSISSTATSNDFTNPRLSLPSSAMMNLNPSILKLQESSCGISSSSNSSDWDTRSSTGSSEGHGTPKFNMNNRGSLSLQLGCSAMGARGKDFDPLIPLDQQSWYHGGLSRTEAEDTLRQYMEGSYLVRSINLHRKEYSLALKSARGYMHIRMHHHSSTCTYTLGRSEERFPSVPVCLHHFTIHRLNIKGAEHILLLNPIPSETL